MQHTRGGDPRGFSDVHPRMACTHGDWVYVARSSIYRISNAQHTTPVRVNYLGYALQLSALVFKHQLPEACFIPGLLIWRTPESTDWLLFDKLTIGPSPPSMDLSPLLTCIRIHPLWH